MQSKNSNQKIKIYANLTKLWRQRAWTLLAKTAPASVARRFDASGALAQEVPSRSLEILKEEPHEIQQIKKIFNVAYALECRLGDIDLAVSQNSRLGDIDLAVSQNKNISTALAQGLVEDYIDILQPLIAEIDWTFVQRFFNAIDAHRQLFMVEMDQLSEKEEVSVQEIFSKLFPGQQTSDLVLGMGSFYGHLIHPSKVKAWEAGPEKDQADEYFFELVRGIDGYRDAEIRIDTKGSALSSIKQYLLNFNDHPEEAHARLQQTHRLRHAIDTMSTAFYKHFNIGEYAQLRELDDAVAIYDVVEEATDRQKHCVAVVNILNLLSNTIRITTEMGGSVPSPKKIIQLLNYIHEKRDQLDHLSFSEIQKSTQSILDELSKHASEFYLYLDRLSIQTGIRCDVLHQPFAAHVQQIWAHTQRGDAEPFDYFKQKRWTQIQEMYHEARKTRVQEADPKKQKSIDLYLSTIKDYARSLDANKELSEEDINPEVVACIDASQYVHPSHFSLSQTVRKNFSTSMNTLCDLMLPIRRQQLLALAVCDSPWQSWDLQDVSCLKNELESLYPRRADSEEDSPEKTKMSVMLSSIEQRLKHLEKVQEQWIALINEDDHLEPTMQAIKDRYVKPDGSLKVPLYTLDQQVRSEILNYVCSKDSTITASYDFISEDQNISLTPEIEEPLKSLIQRLSQTPRVPQHRLRAKLLDADQQPFALAHVSKEILKSLDGYHLLGTEVTLSDLNPQNNVDQARYAVALAIFYKDSACAARCLHDALEHLKNIDQAHSDSLYAILSRHYTPSVSASDPNVRQLRKQALEQVVNNFSSTQSNEEEFFRGWSIWASLSQTTRFFEGIDSADDYQRILLEGTQKLYAHIPPSDRTGLVKEILEYLPQMSRASTSEERLNLFRQMPEFSRRFLEKMDMDASLKTLLRHALEKFQETNPSEPTNPLNFIFQVIRSDVGVFLEEILDFVEHCADDDVACPPELSVLKQMYKENKEAVKKGVTAYLNNPEASTWTLASSAGLGLIFDAVKNFGTIQNLLKKCQNPLEFFKDPVWNTFLTKVLSKQLHIEETSAALLVGVLRDVVEHPEKFQKDAAIDPSKIVSQLQEILEKDQRFVQYSTRQVQELLDGLVPELLQTRSLHAAAFEHVPSLGHLLQFNPQTLETLDQTIQTKIQEILALNQKFQTELTSQGSSLVQAVLDPLKHLTHIKLPGDPTQEDIQKAPSYFHATLLRTQDPKLKAWARMSVLMQNMQNEIEDQIAGLELTSDMQQLYGYQYLGFSIYRIADSVMDSPDHRKAAYLKALHNTVTLTRELFVYFALARSSAAYISTAPILADLNAALQTQMLHLKTMRASLLAKGEADHVFESNPDSSLQSFASVMSVYQNIWNAYEALPQGLIELDRLCFKMGLDTKKVCARYVDPILGVPAEALTMLGISHEHVYPFMSQRKAHHPSNEPAPDLSEADRILKEQGIQSFNAIEQEKPVMVQAPPQASRNFAVLVCLRAWEEIKHFLLMIYRLVVNAAIALSYRWDQYFGKDRPQAELAGARP